MAYIHPLHVALSMSLPMGMECMTWAGEEGTGDPLRVTIKALSALRVGDHTAATPKTRDAFVALLERYGGTTLDQIRLVVFLFPDIPRRRRQHAPPPVFRAPAERGDALIRQADEAEPDDKT